MSIPELTAAIDALQVRVDALTARLDAIEGKPVSTPARYFRSNWTGAIRKFSADGGFFRLNSSEWEGGNEVQIQNVLNDSWVEITAAEGEPS